MHQISKTWDEQSNVKYLNNFFISENIKALSISTAWVSFHLKLGFQERDEGI